jgi:hypothetical protein
MDEEEFDSLMPARTFGTEQAMWADADLRRSMTLSATLGVALWGRTSDDLQRQLLAPYPEIPSGFDLSDFRKLLRVTAQIIFGLEVAQKMARLSHLGLSAPTIFVGTQRFTEWEARCEIVRRAIQYLEKC